MNLRIAANTGFVLALTAGAVIAYPTNAHPTTGPVTAGNGWKLQAPRITHIDTKPWQIVFHDTTSRTKLTRYAKNVAAELTTLGVPVTVSTRIVPTTPGKCPPSHTIAYRWISKPNPDRPNQSFAGACSLSGAAYSGYAYINSDYWAPGRRFRESQRMNVIWHETGHTLGLTHPAKCPRDKKTGRRPLMCDVNSWKSLSSRRYTAFENEAFKQLRANRTRVAR